MEKYFKYEIMEFALIGSAASVDITNNPQCWQTKKLFEYALS